MKEGWQSKRLDELFDVKSSKRVLQSEWKDSGVPFYRGREITRLSKLGTVDNEIFIDEAHYQSLKTKYGVPQPEDLMVTAIGTIGNAYIVQEHDRFYFKDASVLWLKKTSDVVSRYILYWIDSSAFRTQLDVGNGATVDTLTISKLASLQVPLPMPDEQRRIVAILDEAFEGIDRARANVEANLASAKEFLAVTIDAVMNANSEAALVPLGQYCEFENGDRGKNYPGRKAFVPQGVPFINAGHLQNGPIAWNEMNYIPEDHFHRLSNGKVQRGDVLFCLRGSLGKFAIVDTDDQGAIASSLVIVRPFETLSSDYLAIYFESGLCSSMIEKFENGAAQPNLSAKSLGSFLIPVPSTEKQKEIVISINEIRVMVQGLAERYVEKSKALDALRQSLLQKAFAGELT